MTNTERGTTYRIGEVYLMKFCGNGNTQDGWRPGLVFQNNLGNRHSPNVVALPLTSAIKKAGQPTHVVIKAKESGLVKDSMVLCENPVPMPKEQIGKYLTTLSDEHMKQVAEAYLLASSAIAFLEMEMLFEVWQRAKVLNETA